VLAHFDTEAIYALIAPRPMLMLSGDQDGGVPTDGIEVLERKLGAAYTLYGKPGDFRSVIYEKTGHEYLPEMKAEMLAWFETHLPVGEGGSRADPKPRGVSRNGDPRRGWTWRTPAGRPASCSWPSSSSLPAMRDPMTP